MLTGKARERIANETIGTMPSYEYRRKLANLTPNQMASGKRHPSRQVLANVKHLNRSDQTIQHLT